MIPALGYPSSTSSTTEQEDKLCEDQLNQPLDEVFSRNFSKMNPFSSNPFDKVKELGSQVTSKLPFGNKEDAPQTEQQQAAPVQQDQVQQAPAGAAPADAGAAGSGSFFDKMSSMGSSALNSGKDLGSNFGSKVGGLFGQKPSTPTGDVPQDQAMGGAPVDQQQQQQLAANPSAPVEQAQPQQQMADGTAPPPDGDAGEAQGIDKLKNMGAGLFESGKQIGGGLFSSIKSTVEDKMGKK